MLRYLTVGELMIYESNNYQNNWNGTTSKASVGNADKVPNGTYYYIITLKNSGLEPFTGPYLRRNQIKYNL